MLASPLSRYLYYRWATVHFAFMVSIASLIAVYFLTEQQSLFDKHETLVKRVSWGVLGAGVWQAMFLFRVERNLMSESRWLDALVETTREDGGRVTSASSTAPASRP